MLRIIGMMIAVALAFAAMFTAVKLGIDSLLVTGLIAGILGWVFVILRRPPPPKWPRRRPW
jgi:hypothetical protein